MSYHGQNWSNLAISLKVALNQINKGNMRKENLGLHWPPNANEIKPKKTLNVHGQHKNVAFETQRNLYSTDLRWGFALDDANLKFTSPNASHF